MSFSFDQSQTSSQGFNSGHAVGTRISFILSYFSKNRSIRFTVWTQLAKRCRNQSYRPRSVIRLRWLEIITIGFIHTVPGYQAMDT